MNDRRLPASRFSLAACAAAAVVATTILFGGIDVLADHYASVRHATQAAATTAVVPPAG